MLTVPTLLLTADVERGAIASRLVTGQVQARSAMGGNPCRVQVRHVAGAGSGIHDQRLRAFLAAALPFLATHAAR